MKLFLNKDEFIDTRKGIDISIPLYSDENTVNAWNCDPIRIEPVKAGGFVGDVNQGGSVNFKNITLNPHGNGTHTECVGHIAKENYTINQCLKEFIFRAKLITVNPKKISNDSVIDRECLNGLHFDSFSDDISALIVRTKINTSEKLTKDYSGTNPTYFSKDAIDLINISGIDHLLVDLPSIDKEDDGGEVVGHKVFWNYPELPKTHKTITELIYVPNPILDGEYIVSIQIISIESDASPSKIILHEIYRNNNGE